MTDYTAGTQDFALPLPIARTASQIAQGFAYQQPTSQKAEQVRQNTLAVLVVNDYLQLMGIPTHLEASDSWNPTLRLCADVADLELPGMGRLECRPVSPSQSACPIPAETWDDRIGYAVVELDEAAQSARLLGFVPAAEVEELPLNQLQPPEAMIDYLADLQPVNWVETAQQAMVNLGQWFQGAIDQGWQTIEDLLNPPQLSPAYAFRMRRPNTAVQRAKALDLGIRAGAQPVALLVEVSPTAESGQIDVLLQVHPMGGGAFLPEGLQLEVLDQSGAVFLQAEARSEDNYIQLAFSGEVGESFRVRVGLGNTSITEAFVL